jgi:hypothetical protein
MICFALPNLSAHEVQRLEIKDPPAHNSLPPFKTKTAYRQWAAHPSTTHQFISCVEGTEAARRVSKNNPPALIHGAIAEFDAKATSDRLERARGCPHPPSFISSTFSQNSRMYWEFPQALSWVNRGFWDEFTRLFWNELKADQIQPGFKFKESNDTSHYFEIGHDWQRICQGPALAPELVQGILARAGSSAHWTSEGFVLPLDKVRSECSRRWPGAWPGGWTNFTVGARGSAFWRGGDALSAIVTETGMLCFSDPGRLFTPWSKILGDNWTRHAIDLALGDAVANTFFNAANGKFIVGKTNAGWIHQSHEDLTRRYIDAGLSFKVPKDNSLPEGHKAFLLVQNTRSVHGAFSFFHRPQQLIHVGSKTYLNTSRVKLLQPLEEPRDWAQQFPLLSEHLENLLGDQLHHLLSWIAYFYQTCLNGLPRSGLILFLAGPTNCGKTFTIETVLGPIFGQLADASRYMTGMDSFNGSLFESPLWIVDDAVASSSPNAHRIYSERIKAASSNSSGAIRAMYHESVHMPWAGRIVVLLNDDPESLRMLPSAEGGIRDKCLVLRALKNPTNFQRLLTALPHELPHFCSFLRDFPTLQSLRFGQIPFQAQDLWQNAEDNLPSAAVLELLLQWSSVFFKDRDDPTWEGTATALLSEFENVEALKGIATRLVPDAARLGKNLNKLINQQTPGLCFHRTTQARLYQIAYQHLHRQPPTAANLPSS